MEDFMQEAVVYLKRAELFKVAKKLYIRIVADEITTLGAQVSYYLLLSFFPFLIFLVTFISYTGLVTEDSIAPLSMFLPRSVYLLINDVLRNIFFSRNKLILSISMAVTIWSASTGILAFMNGMNRAYRIKENRPFWKVKALSIVFTLALALIIIVSILLVVFGELLGSHISYVFHIAWVSDLLWDIFRYVSSIITIFIVFILFYIYVPSCSLSSRDVIPGSILSTAGWILLSVGFAFYVDNFASYSRIYGSIGAVIALMIWLYWSSIIIFAGSELNSILYKGIKKPKCK